ncbi:MAG: PKD domain-containing protein, partial [Flavobacteriaceae bacterium]
EIPVSNGTFDINLHFAEIYFGVMTGGAEGGVGSRVFNVDIEGGQVTLTNYDIIAEAGAAATAIIENFTNITVSDGSLTIVLTGVVDSPKINGIEVFNVTDSDKSPIAYAGDDQEVTLPNDTITLDGNGEDPDGGNITTYAWTQISGPNTATLSGASTDDLTASDLVEGTYVFRLTVTDDENQTGYDEVTVTVESAPFVIRINSGGPEITYGDEVWSADQHFVGGAINSNTIAIANTENDALYQTERFSTSNGGLIYQIPVGSGNYRVVLHFAEIYFGADGGASGGVGSRVFNINVEGSDVSGYDIIEAAGGSATAVVETFTFVEVDDGILNIVLTAVENFPKLSGIEVFELRPPVVDAGQDQNILLPTSTTTLNGTASDPDGSESWTYQWTQESGPNTASLQGDTTLDLAVSGLIEGTYVFGLTVTDDDNETGYDEVTVTVSSSNEGPTAVASATPMTGEAPLEVTFTGENSTDDVGIVSYAWNFGDGNTSTEMNPIHTYSTAGTYTVELTVTDGDDATDSTTLSIVVESANQPPTAVASATPMTGEAPLEVTFTGEDSTDDVGVVSYAWNFGDGNTSTEMNPTHTYDTAGTFTVQLTVTDGGDATDSTTLSIVVSENTNQPPVAVIEATPTNGRAPLEVNFSGEDSTDDVEVVSYAWDFGDDNTSSAQNPTHTYQSSGVYTATLTVTDGGGLTHSATISITVTNFGDKIVGIILENPAKEGMAKIEMINMPEDVSVVGANLHDSSGRLIETYTLQEIMVEANSYEIPVMALRDGLYYITMGLNGEESVILKLMVKN